MCSSDLDIHKGANYVFRLSARNKMGYGEEAVTEVTMPEDAPSGFPQNILSEGASASSIRLAWKTVPLIEQNGKIIKYTVRYKDISRRGDATEVSVAAPASSVVLEALMTDTVYDVRVCAYTAMGPGPYSPSVQVRTQLLDQGRAHTHTHSRTHIHSPAFHLHPPPRYAHPGCFFGGGLVQLLSSQTHTLTHTNPRGAS